MVVDCLSMHRPIPLFALGFLCLRYCGVGGLSVKMVRAFRGCWACRLAVGVRVAGVELLRSMGGHTRPSPVKREYFAWQPRVHRAAFGDALPACRPRYSHFRASPTVARWVGYQHLHGGQDADPGETADHGGHSRGWPVA